VCDVEGYIYIIYDRWDRGNRERKKIYDMIAAVSNAILLPIYISSQLYSVIVIITCLTTVGPVINPHLQPRTPLNPSACYLDIYHTTSLNHISHQPQTNSHPHPKQPDLSHHYPIHFIPEQVSTCNTYIVCNLSKDHQHTLTSLPFRIPDSVGKTYPRDILGLL
jgi:hypothetical protein